MPLEDAVDLAEIVEETGRTVPRMDWADECIQARKRALVEAMLA